MSNRIHTQLATLGLAIVFLASAACGSGEQQSSGTPAGASPKHAPTTTAVRVEVAAMQAGASMLRIERPGEVQGAREANLASAMGGFIESVRVEAGNSIEKGKPIAYVDTGLYNAQAKLTNVEVADAKRELARLERLGKSVASARVDAARTRLERANAQHALSRIRQARAVVRAPFAGVVVTVDVERGEIAAPGMPIARLIQIDPVHVSVSVADRDIAALSVGGKAYVTTTGSPEPVEGVIHRIEQAADLQTRTFLVEVELANAEKRLLPGMLARVSFESQRADKAILIPQDFLVTRLDGNGVFVVDDNQTARWRPLSLGAIIGTQAEVASGLTVGERVINIGHRALSDGDRVIVTRAGECCVNGRVVYPKSAALLDNKPANSEVPSTPPRTDPTPSKREERQQ